jgi:imidazoleglycerol phosphate dehydratase HisB
MFVRQRLVWCALHDVKQSTKVIERTSTYHHPMDNVIIVCKFDWTNRIMISMLGYSRADEEAHDKRDCTASHLI